MEAVVSRRRLVAYLVGAGVAGTALIAPYLGRSVIAAIAPDFASLTSVPFFLLPVAWGLWNVLGLRLRARPGIGTWGAVLGVLLALAVNVLLAAEARWFPGALLLPVVLPLVYHVVWAVIIGPLNVALGVEP